MVVDPGDAAPVLSALNARGLCLEAILVTHHHDDHTAGIAPLIEAYPARVYASAGEPCPYPHHPVRDGDIVHLAGLDLDMHVMETPGHTLGHVVYYGANCLFCGDTLFGCGCGRLFEGPCTQLFRSLQRLTALPPETRVFSAHEYTLQNIRFARTVDPENPELEKRQAHAQRCASQGVPTLPSTLALELATNPFLRCNHPSIRKATGTTSEESAFCALRTMKNSF